MDGKAPHLQDLDHGLADLGGLVVEVEVLALLLAAVPSNGRDVDQARAEFNEGAATVENKNKEARRPTERGSRENANK